MVTWVPDSCTLPTAEQPLRAREFDAFFATTTHPAERIGPTELLLYLPADDRTAARARELVARETQCCSMFAMQVRQSPTGTQLSVRVPPGQTAVLEAMQQRAEAARTTGDQG